MNFLSVNYHYIGNTTYPFSGIYELPVDVLIKQLNELKKAFSFISQKDLMDGLIGGKPFSEQSCLITFDDGLACQYDLALPVLDELQIPAVFFVNGEPYKDECVLHIHKIHWCRSHIETNVFMNLITEEYKKCTGSYLDADSISPSDTILKKLYFYDDINVARLKFILSRNVLPGDIEKKIISNIFRRLVPDEREFSRKFYMSKNELIYLHSRGMLGCHGFNHKSWLNFDKINFLKDIVEWKEMMRKIGIDYKNITLSYPYGHIKDDLIQESAKELSEMGVVAGFTVDRRINRDLKNPYSLARIDTNDAPGGKYPLMEIVNKKINITSERFIT